MNAQVNDTGKLTTAAGQTSPRVLASLLLAAGVATLVVIADHLMASWAERHEVAAWLALWGIAVLAMALLRGLSRMLACKAMSALDQWSARLARRRADQRLWSMAQTDERLMADLQSALQRSGQSAPRDVVDLGQRRAARILREGLHYI